MKTQGQGISLPGRNCWADSFSMGLSARMARLPSPKVTDVHSPVQGSTANTAALHALLHPALVIFCSRLLHAMPCYRWSSYWCALECMKLNPSFTSHHHQWIWGTFCKILPPAALYLGNVCSLHWALCHAELRAAGSCEPKLVMADVSKWKRIPSPESFQCFILVYQSRQAMKRERNIRRICRSHRERFSFQSDARKSQPFHHHSVPSWNQNLMVNAKLSQTESWSLADTGEVTHRYKETGNQRVLSSRKAEPVPHSTMPQTQQWLWGLPAKGEPQAANLWQEAHILPPPSGMGFSLPPGPLSSPEVRLFLLI